MSTKPVIHILVRYEESIFLKKLKYVQAKLILISSISKRLSLNVFKDLLGQIPVFIKHALDTITIPLLHVLHVTFLHVYCG
jgi:hypothetical protein